MDKVLQFFSMIITVCTQYTFKMFFTVKRNPCGKRHIQRTMMLACEKSVAMVRPMSRNWWGTIANPVRTFLHQNDFSGKTVVPFIPHGTSGLYVQDVTKLCPGAKVLNGHGIFNSYQVSTKKNAPENMENYQADIDRWLGKIGF